MPTTAQRFKKNVQSAPDIAGRVARPRVTTAIATAPVTAKGFSFGKRCNPDIPGRVSGRRQPGMNHALDIKSVDAGYGQTLRAGSGISQAFGNPAPSLALGCGSQPMDFRIPVSTGTRIVKVDFLQPGLVTLARPRMIIRANPQIGIPADTYVDGAAGSSWNTVSITLAITQSGGIHVCLYNPAIYPNLAYADNLKVT